MAREEKYWKAHVKRVGLKWQKSSGGNELEATREWGKDMEKDCNVADFSYHVSLVSVSIPYAILSYTAPPSITAICHIIALLDLALNKSQSNSNPQISEYFPP